MVAFIGWNPYESNPAFIVVIAHGGGISTLYAHMLATYPVSVGADRSGRVSASATWAAPAAASAATFTARSGPGGDWQPVNPYAYLP